MLRGLLTSLALLAAAAPAWADLKGEAERLMPTAVKARAAILNHATLAPFELDSAIRAAMDEMAQVPEGKDLYARKVNKVATLLEGPVAPMREVPSINMHLVLGAVAAEEGREEDSVYHKAYVWALYRCITADGDGLTPKTAFKAVLVDDEYAYFKIEGVRVRPNQRVALEVDGRRYDVWTLRGKSGPTKVYFDITDMMEAGARAFDAREKASRR